MAELTEEQKAKAAEAKAEKEAKASAVKAEKEAKAAIAKAEKEAKSTSPKVKVNFGVEIPGVGKFTKEDIEADADIQEMLLEIGSQAVTKL
jgi:chorismate synthase